MKKRLLGLVCLLLGVAAGALAASHWTVNPYGYQYDITVYATLQIGTHTIAPDFGGFNISDNSASMKRR